MSKWEDKYNELKLNIDNMIQEQDNKMNQARRKQAEIGNDTESKDYKELKTELKQANAEKKRLEKIKPNLGKISNIIEYRDSLKKELDELKKEAGFRKEMGEATKKKEELETEIARYQERYEKINKELRNDKLSADEKKKLENEREAISEKMPKAQEEWDKQDKILQDGLGKKGNSSNLSQEEINNKLSETQTKISKCNFVAKNMLEGLSWDSIDLKLDKWQDRKFTSKDKKLSNKDKTTDGKVNPDKKIDGKYDGIMNFDDDRQIFSSQKKLKEYEKMKNKMEKRAEFANKHPRLAKIGNWFRKVLKRDEMLPEGNDGKEVEQKAEQTDKSFKEYIKYVAEYGEKDARRKQLEEKFGRESQKPKMTEKSREAFRQIDQIVKEAEEGREPGDD